MLRLSPRNGSGRAETSGSRTSGLQASQRVEHTFAPRLLTSRLRPPQPLLELVRRDAVLKQLSSARAPLIVVSAPGGYGKTITLSQWFASEARPVAWLQADEVDNDHLLFLHYLVAALAGVLDVDPLVAGWLQVVPPPLETRILPSLAAAVNGASPFVFVLDDAHLLTNDACWRSSACSSSSCRPARTSASADEPRRACLSPVCARPDSCSNSAPRSSP